MNTFCQGKFFIADENRYYYCFWDGTITIIQEQPERCPHCHRIIEAEWVAPEIRTARQVKLRNKWLNLPE